MKPGAGQGVTVAGGPTCTEDTATNIIPCLGWRPGAPKWVPGWCRVGRGGAGGVVQFFDKVVDLWLPWGRLWWSCSSWTRLLAFPLVSRASVTCLLGFEQGVYVFFVGVKGVVDVLAGLCLGVYFFVGVKGVDDILAGV